MLRVPDVRLDPGRVPSADHRDRDNEHLDGAVAHIARKVRGGRRGQNKHQPREESRGETIVIYAGRERDKTFSNNAQFETELEPRYDVAQQPHGKLEEK